MIYNHDTQSGVIPGVVSGIVGFLVFLIIHALWIMPIWFIFPIGLLIAAIGGVAVGWAYSVIYQQLPPRPWRSLALMLLVCLILLPATVLGEMRPPMFVPTRMGGVMVSELVVPPVEVFVRFVLELMVTASVAGGILGWWIGRTKRAAIATATAGFIFALGPGHNIPLIGGGGVYYLSKEIAIMLSVIVVASVTLVEVHHVLTKEVHEIRYSSFLDTEDNVR